MEQKGSQFCPYVIEKLDPTNPNSPHVFAPPCHPDQVASNKDQVVCQLCDIATCKAIDRGYGNYLANKNALHQAGRNNAVDTAARSFRH
jgi:hypothetical protein